MDNSITAAQTTLDVDCDVRQSRITVVGMLSRDATSVMHESPYLVQLYLNQSGGQALSLALFEGRSHRVVYGGV